MIVNLKNKKGFTLIELIVVIGIIAILSAMVIAILNPFEQFKKVRDAQRKSDLVQIQKALEQYYQDAGSYPKSTTGFKIIGLNSGTIDWGTTNANNWPYMNELPIDPDSSRTYVYYSTGQAYYLYAALERSTDPQVCNLGNACVTLGGVGFPTKYACSKNGGTSIVCNYGATSPNTSP